MEVVGIGTNTREKEKKNQFMFWVFITPFSFSLTKFNLSSLFGPILASFCDSAGLT